ncbi:MAG TPA: hypothetical protein VFK32_03050, partial [Tepidiformaceae bacterium]|nr:hypothetical protein [Tepidiformaceae bacterium]
MTPEEFHEALHGPAEPEVRRLIPEWGLLWRGLALGAAAVAAGWAAWSAVRGPWVAWPVGGVLGV